MNDLEKAIMKNIKREPYSCPICGESIDYPKYSIGRLGFLRDHYYTHNLDKLSAEPKQEVNR